MAMARKPRTLAFTQAACLQALLFTLTATAVLAAYDGSLFAWHPILMTLAFPLLSFSAANVMRSRGLGAHSTHVWLQMGAGQGLILVHSMPQPQPVLSLKCTETTQRVPQKALTSNRKVDVGKPLARGCARWAGWWSCTASRRAKAGNERVVETKLGDLKSTPFPRPLCTDDDVSELCYAECPARVGAKGRQPSLCSNQAVGHGPELPPEER
jgi:hypothetical protein